MKQPLGRAFANLFGASLASNLGDGIVRMATTLLAARLTDDALLIGGIGAMAMLPWLLFAVPSGIVVDRIDRRVALATAQAVRVMLTALLLWLTGTGTLTIWWLYGIVLVYGTFETLYDGASRAIPPSIVPTAGLPRANGYLEAGEQVTQQFLAGPLTSALFAVSVLIPVGINGVCFLAAGVLALLLPRAASGRQHAPTDQPSAPWYRQFTDGWRFIVGNRMLVTLWVVSSVLGFCTSYATASEVLYLLGPVGVPEAMIGLVTMSGAVGGMAGATLADRCKRWLGFGPAVLTGALVASVGIALMGVIPNPWTVVAGIMLSSLGITLWNVLVVSLRQAVIPGNLLGRVHGTWRTVLWGTTTLASVLGGLVGRVDLALPLLTGGAVGLALALVMNRFLRGLPSPEDV